MAISVNNEYPWYHIVDAGTRINQGDFFYQLQVLNPLKMPDVSSMEADSAVEVVQIDCVVLTHSCDFQNTTPDDYQVLVCPIASATPELINTNDWGQLVNGRMTDAYLLHEFISDEPGMAFRYQLVDLKTVYSIPYRLLREHAVAQGKRVQLQPPYREHLAQAFAKRFMRVGLPIDLPRKRPW